MKKILVVEDNEADQFYNEQVIKSVYDDVELIQAFDGREALDILKSGVEPNLILLDINMPRMSGHEFLASYYDDLDAEIPVVVMLTSSDQKEDQKQVSKYACVRNYFSKPLTEQMVKYLYETAAT